MEPNFGCDLQFICERKQKLVGHIDLGYNLIKLFPVCLILHRHHCFFVILVCMAPLLLLCSVEERVLPSRSPALSARWIPMSPNPLPGGNLVRWKVCSQHNNT